MSIFKSLKLRFKPPKIQDSDFGQLTFMYIPSHPERSYWEAEWIFPPTGTPVNIGLDGDESGPRPETRQWHMELPPRFPRILQLVKPELANVLKLWLDQDLPEDVLSVVRLSGFAVEDPQAHPVKWDISFETIGSKWLGITIPFVGEQTEEAIVDT